MEQVTGQVINRRGFGRTVFATVDSEGSEVDVYLNVNHLNASDFANVLPRLRVGDSITVRGEVFTTPNGGQAFRGNQLTIT